ILTPKDIEIGGPIDRRLTHDWPADMPLVASFEKICASGMGVVYRVYDERLVADVTSGRCGGSAKSSPEGTKGAGHENHKTVLGRRSNRHRTLHGGFIERAAGVSSRGRRDTHGE